MRAARVAVLASLLVVGCTDDLDAEMAPFCMDEMGCPPGTVCVDGVRCVMLPDAEVPRSAPRGSLPGGAPRVGPSRPPGGAQRDGGAGCGAGRTDCGGECVDLRNDPRNCGRCGNACAAGVQCQLGVCCGVGLDLCTDRCVDLQNDSSNCGVCGFTCTNGLQCRFGTCQPPSTTTPPSADPGDPGLPGETPPGSAF